MSIRVLQNIVPRHFSRRTQSRASEGVGDCKSMLAVFRPETVKGFRATNISDSNFARIAAVAVEVAVEHVIVLVMTCASDLYRL